MTSVYLDQQARDNDAIYTYNQIAKIKLVAPETARLLREWYSGVLASGDDDSVRKAGLEVERVFHEYLSELYQKGYV